MTLGQIIQAKRKEQGLTQTELGKRIAVSGSMIGQWENDLRKPKFDTIIRIADALDISILEFFPEHNNELSTFIYREGFEESQEELKDFGYSFSDEEVKLIGYFSKLNIHGQEEAIRSVEIIAGNPIFQRTEPPETLSGDSEGSCTSQREKPSERPSSPSDGK